MSSLSLFYQLSYSKEKSLLQIDWTLNTSEMREQDFKDVLLEILEFIKKERPTWYLANTQDFQFSIVPEVQDWANEVFIPQIVELGVKKMAVILSSDIFAQVSVQQVLDDDRSEMQSAYFDKVDEALKWLR